MKAKRQTKAVLNSATMLDGFWGRITATALSPIGTPTQAAAVRDPSPLLSMDSRELFQRGCAADAVEAAFLQQTPKPSNKSSASRIIRKVNNYKEPS
jgi:hypothetical protein